jgi:hypothetical protein
VLWKIGTAVEHPEMPGYSRLKLQYKILSYDEWLEAHPNHGMLMGQSSATGKRLLVSSDGYRLEGPDETDPTGKSKYIVESGTNQTLPYRAVYEVYSVISSDVTPSGFTGMDVYFYQFVSKVGRYNSQVMYGFLLYPEVSRAGQWLLSEVSMVPRAAASRLYTVRHRFMLCTDTIRGWAEPCISRKWQLVVQSIDAVDEDGDPTGLQGKVATWVPTVSTNTVYTIKDDGGVFQAITQLLTNSY